MHPSSSAPAPRLTDREREVMELVAAGFLRKQIARRLDIAPGTVDAHIANLAGKVPGRGRPAVRITRFYLVRYSSEHVAA